MGGKFEAQGVKFDAHEAMFDVLEAKPEEPSFEVLGAKLEDLGVMGEKVSAVELDARRAKFEAP